MNILRIVLHRNTLLISSLVFALIWGDFSVYLKDYTFYILGLVMSFSMSGIVFGKNGGFKNILKIFSIGILLNFILYGIVMIALSYFLFENNEIFLGFVVIAATPPGVAILPFSYILKGDMNYSLIGVSGAFLGSIVFTPLIIMMFSSNAEISILDLIYMVASLLIIPFLVSRLLIAKKSIEKVVVKIRGKVVDIGFALIIFTAIGLNRGVFMENQELLLKCAAVLFVSTFIIGLLLEFILKRFGYKWNKIISVNLLATIKSSGFAVVTAISLFGKEAAIPSAILSVFVLIYLLFLSFRETLYPAKL